MTTDQNATPMPPDAAAQRLQPVRIWLYVLAAFVLMMVVVGGITRLTDSGLSMTTWKPISGIIPPLSDADWRAEFAGYQAIPQYEYVNAGMDLASFKSIFFWEYMHRFLGRILGFVFLIPFLVFLAQKRLPRRLAWPLFGLFVLGGFQGLLGWWMVSSGLTELTSVSQYRLAAHLCAASLLFMALVFVPRWLKTAPVPGAVASEQFWSAIVLLVLIFIQIGAGAFVAGLDAGMGYNTWPLMDGALIPKGLGAIEPWWRNIFENALTVQFVHRCIAYVIVLYLGVLIWRQSRRQGFAGIHGWLPRLGVIVLLQVILGIATLLSFVPLHLAVAHQALAFMLAGLIVAYLADMVRNHRQTTAV